jgi:hypothetical protein
MSPDYSESSLKTFMLSLNWFGLVTGILMLLLPFLGPWWVGSAGRAMEIALSPFDINVSILGLSIHSSMVGFFLLAAKITFIIAGVFMLLSSIFPKRWWSKRLFKFGIMKPFWSIISLVALLLIGAIIVNTVLPSVLTSMMGGAGGENVAVQMSIPYISGSTASTIQIGNAATVTAPITFSLTGIFWLAVATGILGIIGRIYYRRFETPEETTSRPEERRVIKLKPTEERKVIKVKPSEQKKVIKLRPK